MLSMILPRPRKRYSHWYSQYLDGDIPYDTLKEYSRRRNSLDVKEYTSNETPKTSKEILPMILPRSRRRYFHEIEGYTSNDTPKISKEILPVILRGPRRRYSQWYSKNLDGDTPDDTAKIVKEILPVRIFAIQIWSRITEWKRKNRRSEFMLFLDSRTFTFIVPSDPLLHSSKLGRSDKHVCWLVCANYCIMTLIQSNINYTIFFKFDLLRLEN